MTPLFVHVGYPKTATTTFQKHVFPHHPEIDYLGKFIPGHRYRDERLFPAIDSLMTADECCYEGVAELREIIEQYRSRCTRKVMLLSSESFIHVTATDLGLVAQRVRAAFEPCKIIITIREQRDMIRSFYGMHGRFGQYLFITKSETERLRFPLSVEDWLKYEFRAYNQNLLSTLHYYEIIKYYCKLFGEQNIGIFLFEEFVKDKNDYTKKLCHFLGIDHTTAVRLAVGRHELPNSSRRELGSYKILSRIALQSSSREPAFIPEFLGRSPKARVEISNAWQDKLKELYAKGNQALARELEVPLERFGYF